MRLESEGLVLTLPRQGYRVAPVSLPDVLDMFHLRAALERACMERVALHSSTEQLATLDEFRHFDPTAWQGGFIAYNRAFHRRLSELGGNARLRVKGDRDTVGTTLESEDRRVGPRPDDGIGAHHLVVGPIDRAA